MDLKYIDKVFDMPIGSISAYEGSHKTDEAVEIIMQSIADFGFQQPIVIDKNNTVVAGNAILKAAQKLNISKVPCIKVEHLDEEEVNQYRIADNKTSEFASWNEKKLRKELSYLESPSSLQYCFDEDILGMLGMNKPAPIQIETAEPAKKHHVLTTDEIISKDKKFKDEIKSIDTSMMLTPSQYITFTCSKCGKTVKIKK